jgi:uncharacterized protein (DUF305 family)
MVAGWAMPYRYRLGMIGIGVAVAMAGLHILLLDRSQGHDHGQSHGMPAGRHSAGLPQAAAPLQEMGFVQEMDRDMAKMMRDMHAPGYTGRPDVDFLAMMIPHHQGAVDMARAVLRHGEDPLTRRLAEDIIAGQQAEIAAMTARLAILQRGPDPAPGGFPSLGGTRGR